MFQFWAGRMLPGCSRLSTSFARFRKSQILLIALGLIVGMATVVQSSTSEPISYPAFFLNPFPFTILAGSLAIDIDLFADISGTATITGPNGGVEVIEVYGPGDSTHTIILSEVGTYEVSGRYHMELTGNALDVMETVTGDAMDSSSFFNPAPAALVCLLLAIAIILVSACQV